MSVRAPWVTDYSEILRLARWLDDQGTFESCRDMLAYFEKPWNWDNDRNEMLAAEMLAAKTGAP